MKKGFILVVDDNKGILEALNILLPLYFNKVVLLSSPKTLHNELLKFDYDVVLLDMNFEAGLNSGNEGLFWLKEIKKDSPFTEVVMFTAYAEVDLAINAMKAGAYDFVVKPWENTKLIATLRAACEMSDSRKEVKHLKEVKREISANSHNETAMFWGKSAAMLSLSELVSKVAQTDAEILITGENGTGKDVLAKEIHRLSLRQKEPMVTVDVGSLPESLFESELFGHVKGSFTDAKSDRIGKFEIADGGTLFLDEVGNIPIYLQSKLLTALQTRQIVRVGSNKAKRINIRLISATNISLPERVAEGKFREDLLYRINMIHLELPPLRERREDIMPFARLFLKRFAAKYNKNINRITKAAAAKLTEYSWKGNVRELQHTVEKAVILSDKECLDVDDFLLSSVQLNDKRVDLENASLEDVEKKMIKLVIAKHQGNLSLVAKQLGVTRQTLYNKLKKYGL